MIIEIFQSMRLRRCCQMASLAFTKLSVCTARSRAGSGSADSAGMPGTSRTTGRKRPKKRGRILPNMYHTVPHCIGQCDVIYAIYAEFGQLHWFEWEHPKLRIGEFRKYKVRPAA